MLTFYTHLAAAGVAAALAWGVAGWRHGEAMAARDVAELTQRVDNAAESQRITARYQGIKDDALQRAQTRAQAAGRAAAGARAAADRLRDDLANVPQRIARASRGAVDEYAATATIVFEQCARRLSDLAAAADGHANDAAALTESWPK